MQFDKLRRRDVVALLGGAAIGWPLSARAQAERMRHIGVLMGIAESDPARQSFVSAFTGALQELGWSNGRNIQIEYRWGAGDAERIRNFARELVEMRLDLIVGHTTPVVAALKAQTRTIPIVFTQVSDPFGSGFIDGFAKPASKFLCLPTGIACLRHTPTVCLPRAEACCPMAPISPICFAAPRRTSIAF